MTEVHLVSVHPTLNGKPDLSQTLLRRRFQTKEAALRWVESYNRHSVVYGDEDEAVYHGVTRGKPTYEEFCEKFEVNIEPQSVEELKKLHGIDHSEIVEMARRHEYEAYIKGAEE